MTVSGQRASVENVAAPNPHRGAGAAPDMSAEPLPDGWGSFVSEAGGGVPSHWYASSPYPVDRLKRERGRDAYGLVPTVFGATYEELRAAALAQAELYERLTRPGQS